MTTPTSGSAGTSLPTTGTAGQPSVSSGGTLGSRQGLNCTLSYTMPSGGQTVTYQVRAVEFGYGIVQLSAEQMSRTRRAFYPRNVVESQFNLKVVLKGVSERADFSNFIQNYAVNYLAPNAQFPPPISIVIPSMGITEYGIPMSGFSWGNNVGAMMWTPTIAFQPTQSTATPQGAQRTGGTGYSALDQSSYNSAVAKMPELKYFFPEGVQLSGNTAPPNGSWTPLPAIPASAVDSTAGGTHQPTTDQGLPGQAVNQGGFSY